MEDTGLVIFLLFILLSPLILFVSYLAYVIIRDKIDGKRNKR